VAPWSPTADRALGHRIDRLLLVDDAERQRHEPVVREVGAPEPGVPATLQPEAFLEGDQRGTKVRWIRPVARSQRAGGRRFTFRRPTEGHRGRERYDRRGAASTAVTSISTDEDTLTISLAVDQMHELLVE